MIHCPAAARLLMLAGLVLANLGAVPSASAQAFDAVRLYGAASGRDSGTLGAAIISGRQYMGSDEGRTLLLPAIDYQWTNGFFAGTVNGIGFNFSRRPEMSYGLRATADFGRKESRSSALRGLGDIDARPEIGGFYNYALSPAFALTSSLRYGSGNERNGLLVDVGAAWSTELAPRWRLGLGVATTYANADYMQSYFGISAGQSARSGYALYSPSGGLRDARANAALTYSINPSWAVTTAISASSLLGDAKDSPITRDRNSLSGIVSLLYRF